MHRQINACYAHPQQIVWYAAPADSLAIIGLVVAFDLTVFVYMPAAVQALPKMAKNAAYKPVVFTTGSRCANVRKLHVRLANDHFVPLVADEKALKVSAKSGAPPLIMHGGDDPATGMCASNYYTLEYLQRLISAATLVTPDINFRLQCMPVTHRFVHQAMY